MPLKPIIDVEGKRRAELLAALTEKGVLAPWGDEYGRLDPPPPYAGRHFNLCDDFIENGKGQVASIVATLVEEVRAVLCPGALVLTFFRPASACAANIPNSTNTLLSDSASHHA